jgi:hypothetical protein
MSWDGMRYDANYLPQGLPNIYSQEAWLSLLSMYFGTPAIAQAISVNPVSLPPTVALSSAKLSGGGGEKWIFLPHCHDRHSTSANPIPQST